MYWDYHLERAIWTHPLLEGHTSSKVERGRDDPLKQRICQKNGNLSKLSRRRSYGIFISWCLHHQRRLDHTSPLQLSSPACRARGAEEIFFKTGWAKYQSGYIHLQGLLIVARRGYKVWETGAGEGLQSLAKSWSRTWYFSHHPPWTWHWIGEEWLCFDLRRSPIPCHAKLEIKNLQTQEDHL